MATAVADLVDRLKHAKSDEDHLAALLLIPVVATKAGLSEEDCQLLLKAVPLPYVRQLLHDGVVNRQLAQIESAVVILSILVDLSREKVATVSSFSDSLNDLYASIELISTSDTALLSNCFVLISHIVTMDIDRDKSFAVQTLWNTKAIDWNVLLVECPAVIWLTINFGAAKLADAVSEPSNIDSEQVKHVCRQLTKIIRVINYDKLQFSNSTVVCFSQVRIACRKMLQSRTDDSLRQSVLMLASSALNLLKADFIASDPQFLALLCNLAVVEIQMQLDALVPTYSLSLPFLVSLISSVECVQDPSSPNHSTCECVDAVDLLGACCSSVETAMDIAESDPSPISDQHAMVVAECVQRCVTFILELHSEADRQTITIPNDVRLALCRLTAAFLSTGGAATLQQDVLRTGLFTIFKFSKNRTSLSDAERTVSRLVISSLRMIPTSCVPDNALDSCFSHLQLEWENGCWSEITACCLTVGSLKNFPLQPSIAYGSFIITALAEHPTITDTTELALLELSLLGSALVCLSRWFRNEQAQKLYRQLLDLAPDIYERSRSVVMPEEAQELVDTTMKAVRKTTNSDSTLLDSLGSRDFWLKITAV